MIFSSPRYSTLLAALYVVITSACAHAQELWKVELESKAAIAPIVADILESPGPETIVVMENGMVRVILADGRSAWSATVDKDAQKTSQPCVVPASEGLSALLIVPTVPFGLMALDCTTGEKVWRTEDLFSMGIIWCASADLDDDRVPEVIASSMDGRVVALRTTDGSEMWHWPTDGRTPVLGAGPPCVADIDNDFAPEIYIPQDAGLLSLDARGEERFRTVSEGKPIDGPVVGDLDDDGRYEVYVVATGDAVEAFDADTGDALWRVVLPMCKGSGADLAIADLDQDEVSELIAWGTQANVISGMGKLLFQSTLPAKGFAIGDANSDGEVELLGFAEHKLVLFDAALGERARVELPTATEHAPALASLGGASVVYLGADQTLRAVRTGPRLMPQLAPWPQLRRDATGRAAALSAVGEANLHSSGPQLAASNAPIALSTTWDMQADIDAWQAQKDSRIDLAVEKKAAGTGAILVTPSPDGGTSVVSANIPIDPALRRVSATVLAQLPAAGEAQAVLQWKRVSGETVDQPLRATETTPEGWQRFRGSNLAKPAGAIGLAVVLTSTSSTNAPVVWDELQITGQYMAVPAVEVFCNQVGYEVNSPKRFTVATTFTAPDGKFRILNDAGSAVFQGNLDPATRIVGAKNSDWGKYFWRGNFGDFAETGRFRIEVEVDGNTIQSSVFEIAPDLLWTKVFSTAVGALTGMRCSDGCPEPGCLWLGSSNGDCAESLASVRALCEAYVMVRWRFKAQDATIGVPPALLDELRWAGDRLLTQVDSALVAGAQQTSPLASALAAVALAIPENKAYLDAARKLFDAAAADAATAADPALTRALYIAVVDLATVTGDPALIDAAKQRYLGPDAEAPETTTRYDGSVDEMASGAFNVGKALAERADVLLALTGNPFGIPTQTGDDAKRFFGTPVAPTDGNTRYLLESACTVSSAYRFTAKPEYKDLAVDQINWLLGNNPLGISLVEGLGTRTLPSYATANGKATAGAVARGIGAKSAEIDAPNIDLSGNAAPDVNTNGVSVGDTVRLIEVIARLKRIRF